MKTKALLLATLLICCFAAALSAQIPTTEAPRKINFQGKLNNPTSGSVSLTFSIFQTATVGTALWSETHTGVTVINGIFNVLLGSVNPNSNPLPNSVFKNGGDLFLEIKVGNTPLSKRVQIASVAYAIKATHADTAKVALSGGAPDGDWIISGNNMYAGISGNVGIGTTSPSQKLHVSGIGDTKAHVATSGSGNPAILLDASGVNNSELFVNRTDAGHLYINTGGTTRMVIRSDNGNVGIGTTRPIALVHSSGRSDSGRIETFRGENTGNIDFSVNVFGKGYTTRPSTVQLGVNNADGNIALVIDNKNVIEAGTSNNGLFIKSGGNVGIGTANPGRRLHVNGDGSIDDFVRLSIDGQSQNWDIGIGKTVAPGAFFIARAGTSRDFNIDSNGNVGIGVTGPQFKLQVNGKVCADGYDCISDARYKQNITTIPNALDKITHLRGVSFNWRQEEFPELNFSKGRNLGFIAQEIKEVLPEVVSQDSKGYYSVAYSNVVPVLVEAIKEQQNTIAQLQTQVTELAQTKTELASLKERLQRIESLLTSKNATDRPLPVTGQ